MPLYSYGQYSYGPYSYGLYSYTLYGYDLFLGAASLLMSHTRHTHEDVYTHVHTKHHTR